MSGRYLTDLAAVARAAGLDVIEMDGWPTRARGSGGYSSGRPTHVMVHHTASGPGSDGWPDANYCTHGSENAPVANLYLNRAGTVWVMAAGATNTNGAGGPLDNVPADSMNTHAIGIEAGNGGTGEVWPDAQQDAYTALCAALCAAYNIPAGHVRSHEEWAPGRKVDPAGPSRWAPAGGTWPMAGYRADVQDTLDNPEDTVKDQDKRDIAAMVWQEMIHNYQAGADQPAVAMLGFAHSEAANASAKCDQILARLNAT